MGSNIERGGEGLAVLGRELAQELHAYGSQLAGAGPGHGSDSTVPKDWRGWLEFMFPADVREPFAEHHEDFWTWLWAMDESRPRPFAALWPRGGGKSSATELATAVVACRGVRKYVLYVSETQDQADLRVANIAGLLEDLSVEAYYPSVSRPAVTKHGRPKAWRRDRLHADSGFVVDPLGMETAGRGLKVGANRPDLIIVDEVDGRHDTDKTIKKKIVTLTETIFPMGAPNAAVIFAQNLVIGHGVAGQLASGDADFLADRLMSGPIPAIEDMRTHQWFPGAEIPEKVRRESEVDLGDLPKINEGVAVRSIITHGRATWSGLSIPKCQGMIDLSSLAAFERERNHEVFVVEEALWKREWVQHVTECPPLTRIVTGVDPSGGAAEIGIVTAGIDGAGRYYVLADDTQLGRLGPANWGRSAVKAYRDHKGDKIVAEKNFGGDMVNDTIRVAAESLGAGLVIVEMVWASRGKEIRAEPVAALSQERRIFFVGPHPELESEMTRWIPGTKPSPNRMDAFVWAITELSGPTFFHWGDKE